MYNAATIARDLDPQSQYGPRRNLYSSYVNIYKFVCICTRGTMIQITAVLPLVTIRVRISLCWIRPAQQRIRDSAVAGELSVGFAKPLCLVGFVSI